MPKIDINGIVREMTAEEVAEIEALNANIPVIPSRERELEERIANLEAALAALLNQNRE